MSYSPSSYDPMGNLKISVGQNGERKIHSNGTDKFIRDISMYIHVDIQEETCLYIIELYIVVHHKSLS